MDLNASISGKSDEMSENVKWAATDCISMTLETAKYSAEFKKLGAV